MGRYPEQPGRTRRKKLTDLGRYWAGGGRGKSLDSDAEAFGLEIDDHQRDAGAVDLWPEHVDAWRIFTSLRTQWRIIVEPGHDNVPANLIYQGLEYQSLKDMLERSDIEDTNTCFDCVRALEAGALEILNEK